jgi:glycine oxidase
LQPDYLIAGGGIIGLSCAIKLAELDAKIIVLERGLTGSESSWAGGGILSPLCPWDYPEEITRLSHHFPAQFREWVSALHAATGIDPEYEKSGMLVLPSYDIDKARHWCIAHSLRMEEHDGGLLLPDVAQIRNPKLMQALRAKVEQLGVRIVESCEVHSILADTNEVLHLATTQGDFSANRYIVTAGAWSKQLLGKHALNIDIKPIRGQMLLFKFAEPPLAHIVLQDGMYLIPRRDGHLLVGSTLEDVGFDKSTTAEARDSLWQRAQLLLPALREMKPVPVRRIISRLLDVIRNWKICISIAVIFAMA